MPEEIEWTAMMEDTLIFLASEEVSYNQIARVMSNMYGMTFTKNSVVGKASRLGLPRREPAIKPPKPEQPAPVTIYDLEWGMCKWPLAQESDSPPYFYCGKPTDDLGCSWCEDHRKRVWTRSRL
jgi:GcrA cell cycle regulator